MNQPDVVLYLVGSFMTFLATWVALAFQGGDAVSESEKFGTTADH